MAAFSADGLDSIERDFEREFDSRSRGGAASLVLKVNALLCIAMRAAIAVAMRIPAATQ